MTSLPRLARATLRPASALREHSRNLRGTGAGSADLYATADLRLVPVGTEMTTSSFVAEVQNVLEKHNVVYKTHGSGTNIEGSLMDLLRVVAEAHAAVHRIGAPKIESDLRICTTLDHPTSGGPAGSENDRKVRSVEEKKGRGREELSDLE